MKYMYCVLEMGGGGGIENKLMLVAWESHADKHYGSQSEYIDDKGSQDLWMHICKQISSRQ